MSVNLPDVAVTEFESDVWSEFQARGFRTRNAVRLRNNVVGATLQFPVALEGIAQQKAIQADIIPMNADYNPITLTLQDWHAADYSDIQLGCAA